MSLLGRVFGQPFQWIDIPALHQRMEAGEALSLIDVRQPEEYDQPPGHVPGALNIPLPAFPGHVADLLTHRTPIVLICKSDRRSARAAEILCGAGARDVTVLRGGTDAWYQSGLPLEQVTAGMRVQDTPRL